MDKGKGKELGIPGVFNMFLGFRVFGRGLVERLG